MITLIHGDDTIISRNELNHIRNGLSGREIRMVNGKTADINRLIQTLESPSIFGNDTAVIFENLLSSLGRKIKTAGEYCDLLKSASGKGTEIILWEDRIVSPGMIGNLGKNIRISLYKLPALVFTFLDNFRPGNEKFLLDVYGKLSVNEPVELLFAMLLRRIRQLIIIKDGILPEGMQIWQSARLTSQAKYFSMEQLTDMYLRLINIEFSIRSGNSPFDTGKHLELFLTELNKRVI
jgi:DNA polymerase III delta subunit